MRSLALFLVIAGCQTGRLHPQPGPLASSDPSRPDVTVAGVEAAVHTRTNAARRSAGIGTVEADPAIADVARQHSADMAARAYVDHITPEGLGPNDRAARAGLDCRARVSETQTRVGFLENLFQGGLYRSARETTRGAVTTVAYDWLTTDGIAAMTVDGWLASPGHRRNLLDARMVREGVGVAIAPDGRLYVTQMFC